MPELLYKPLNKRKFKHWHLGLQAEATHGKDRTEIFIYVYFDLFITIFIKWGLRYLCNMRVQR